MIRRGFLKGMMGAAAAGPRVARSMTEGLAGQRMAQAGALAGNMVSRHPDSPQPMAMPPALKALFAEERDAENQAMRTHQFRVGGLEPDIAVINSISYAAKVRMQIARDDARRSLIDTIRQKISDWHNNPLRAVLG